MTALEIIGQKAKEAEPKLRILDKACKDEVLLRSADYLVQETAFILKANEQDM